LPSFSLLIAFLVALGIGSCCRLRSQEIQIPNYVLVTSFLAYLVPDGNSPQSVFRALGIHLDQDALYGELSIGKRVFSVKEKGPPS
jgi:hypothetical protein